MSIPVLFGQNAVYSSREELRNAALEKAAEDATKLRVLISQPRRTDRARVYLGCTGNGLKSGTAQCTYRVHATENGGKWQVTKACFTHSHPPKTRNAAQLPLPGHDITQGAEFTSREAFLEAVRARGKQDGVDLRIFVDLGRLARRARFAMCCAHKSRHTHQSKRCPYSFVAIEYERLGWRVTQCNLTHNHDDDVSHVEKPTTALDELIEACGHAEQATPTSPVGRSRRPSGPSADAASIRQQSPSFYTRPCMTFAVASPSEDLWSGSESSESTISSYAATSDEALDAAVVRARGPSLQDLLN